MQKTKIVLIGILLFAAVTRFWNLSYPKGYYFDEVYNAFTTVEMAKGNREAWEWFHTAPKGLAYGWTHPPLAKYLAGVGVQIFGINEFGWRVGNALIGVAVVYLVYHLGVLLSNSHKRALLATAFAASDGLLLVQSRINMNDIVATFFIMLAFVAFVGVQKKFSKFNLLRLAFILGLLLATKWTGLYAIAVFGSWLFLQNIKSFKNLLLLLLTFSIIPLIYILSYSPYFYLGGSWKNFMELQNQMWWYNTTLKATHTYQSSWWTWPIMLRPVWYFVDYAGNTIANIYGMGNPILWWLGIPAIIYTFYSSLKTRSWRLWIIITGFLIFWLPWARAPRIMFLYHYLPSIPFLCIALAYCLSKISNKYLTFGILGLVFISFAYFYPHWVGIHLPKTLVNQYFWFPSWR